VAIHEVRDLFLSDLVFCVVLHAPEQETGAVEPDRARHALDGLRSHDAGDVRMPPVEEQLRHYVVVAVQHVLAGRKVIYDYHDGLELSSWGLLGLELELLASHHGLLLRQDPGELRRIPILETPGLILRDAHTLADELVHWIPVAIRKRSGTPQIDPIEATVAAPRREVIRQEVDDRDRLARAAGRAGEPPRRQHAVHPVVLGLSRRVLRDVLRRTDG